MVEEITIQELAQMEPSACQIIDMRDETAFALGHIDGAVLIPQKGTGNIPRGTAQGQDAGHLLPQRHPQCRRGGTTPG